MEIYSKEEALKMALANFKCDGITISPTFLEKYLEQHGIQLKKNLNNKVLTKRMCAHVKPRRRKIN